jgi:hypothetical protein
MTAWYLSDPTGDPRLIPPSRRSLDKHVSHHFNKGNRQFSALSFALQRAFAAGHILTHKSPIRCALHYYAESFFSFSFLILIRCALHYAELFFGFAKLFPARSVEFFEIAGEMEAEATELLKGLGDDYAASMMLEETESEIMPVMQLALRAGCKEFIGNQRMMRIAQRFWAVPLFRPPAKIVDKTVLTVPGFSFWGDDGRPGYLWNNNSQPYDRREYRSPFETSAGLLHLFVEYPSEFFALPRGRFWIHQVAFIGFIYAFFWMMEWTHATGSDFGRLHIELSISEMGCALFLFGTFYFDRVSTSQRSILCTRRLFCVRTTRIIQLQRCQPPISSSACSVSATFRSAEEFLFPWFRLEYSP